MFCRLREGTQTSEQSAQYFEQTDTNTRKPSYFGGWGRETKYSGKIFPNAARANGRI